MTDNQAGTSRLKAFYSEAQHELSRLAEKYGLSLPEGHAFIDPPILHWRVSAYDGSPQSCWEALWRLNAQGLGLGVDIEPGDLVLDQEGRTWTLLGLDPSGLGLPVRLMDNSGAQSMATIKAASLFQLLVKREKISPESAA